MTTHEFFTRVWDMLIGRATGPMNFRLLLQPTVATILALRAGWADARAGRPAYLWSVFINPAHRRDLMQKGWKDVGKVFIVAVVLDVVYEIIVYRWIYRKRSIFHTLPQVRII